MAKKKIGIFAAVVAVAVGVVGGIHCYKYWDNVTLAAGHVGHWFQNTFGFETTHQFDEESAVVIDSTCTEAGSKTYTCRVCGYEKVEIIELKPHNEETDAAVPSTCTETGLTEGKHCIDCGEVTIAQEVVAATGHTEEIVPGTSATCTESGLTDGTKCSVCDEIIVAQEKISELWHEMVDGECSRCAYMNLAVLYPNGYELVAVNANENMAGRLLQVGKVGEEYSCSYLVSSGGTILPGFIENGVSYSFRLGEIFEYEGYYYVQADNVFAAVLQEGIVYFVEPIVVDNLANWTLPASEGYSVDGNELTFAGTHELTFSTKEKHNSISLTFKVSETQDVRGAFQIGWGAQTTDDSINNLPFVQFNYDRAVLVLPDGTKYDTSWLTGEEWRLTIDSENSNVVLSVDGQVVYNVDASWWTQENWGLPGYLVMRTESNCALTFELVEMNPTA